jgi:uncharacterized protein
MTIEPIDVADLVDRPGASRTVRVRGSVEAPATDVAQILGEIEAELLLESVVEGILVSGRLTGEWSLRCARCLDAFRRPFETDVSEMFVARPEADGDDYPLGPEAAIDPRPLVVDAIGLDLPFAPICRPGCLGLCETCGGNRNLGECPGHEEVDPRWAGLEALLERMND